MGYTYRHAVRLLDKAGLQYKSGPGGTRRYDAAAFEEWWRQHQLRDHDRAANLGPYRRRATDAEGHQVCPGLDQTTESPCGGTLGRTSTGRPRRLCDECRAQADRQKAKRRTVRALARRLVSKKRQ